MASSQRYASQSVTDLAIANNTFAVHLYQTVQDGQNGKNLFFSPLSISTALAMTHLGARGDTATQIANVLQLNKLIGENNPHKAFKELNDLLFHQERSYMLKSANKLYGKSGYQFVQSFLDGTSAHYGSAIESVDDFTSPATTKSINDWVSKQTEGKIAELIAPGMLNSFTRLVLVNAIYLKARWKKVFTPEKTRSDIFKVPDNRQSVPVSLMIQSGEFPLAIDETNNCLVLEMPYEGHGLSMLIALPTKDDGLPELESKLSAEVLQTWNTKLRSRPVNIFLPKFKLEEQFELKEALQKMGMPDAFDGNKANFQGISSDDALQISAVIHKAFVDVNEEGSEAAAATAVHMMMCCSGPFSPEKPIDFRADHPFLFIIRHRPTQAVLFIGRLVDPNKILSQYLTRSVGLNAKSQNIKFQHCSIL